MFTDNERIRKKDIFDPIADDDDIDWKYNLFDVETIDEVIEKAWPYRPHPSRGPPSDRSGTICWSHNPCEGYESE